MKREWVLQRNCSLSPRQLAAAYVLLCIGAFGIALAFVVAGIWIVLGFALLEMAGIAAAMLYHARHAADHEHIALSECCLLVERVRAGRCEKVRLDPHWTWIALPDSRGHGLIRLRSRGVEVEVGSFVSDEVRQQVARELRQELLGTSLMS
jgi:uncharacterized membrane protein